MLKEVANYVGANMLPHANPLVTAPPGRVTGNGTPNVIIATPRRSGTHVTIDLILNNIAAYRQHPLYVNIDPILKNIDTYRDDISQLIAGSGQIIKTHFPYRNFIYPDSYEKLEEIIGASTVIAVRRDVQSIIRSLQTWQSSSRKGNLDVGGPETLEREYREFWDYWGPRANHVVDFQNLFKPEGVAQLLEYCGNGPTASDDIRMPTPKNARLRIYGNKTLTRLIGKHAPKIDTSIFTGH